ncbi:HEAT repeat protein [Rhizodiscina lignyota]|uniref:HEAT repeat protein n=1 Tax=Rhizodiscina lignyota TaxID=1504668 RepID=A0A9P4IPZ3_9PEZI|nr:HEAT repeat protein [Rhizodiscina lignyota]
MAVISRGDKAKRAFKVVKNSKATKSTNKHRFESFSHRITKLNIDPVRRTTSTYQELAEQDLSTYTSHFRASLEEWKDKNLSEHFTNFVQDVELLSETLPQLLHHQQRVAEFLLSYIENGTTISLEPLLDLLAQFAHDLGARFETFFERSVRILSTIASTNPDIEVIEWSLNTIVWLFKYLSRLLVPDLRPTYDLLAPLLGKEKQKPFIARFAAEGFSFLLRKAGVAYHKNKEPLNKIVEHILRDLRGSEVSELYQQGIMSLFAESMRGVQKGLHSAALPILQELLRIGVDKRNGSENLAQRAVIHGTVIALIHHCDAESFKPALDVIIDATEVSVDGNETDIEMSVRFLSELAGVRSGSRIANWKPVLDRLKALFDLFERNPSTYEPLSADVLASAAIAFQYCPMDAVLPYVHLLERTNTKPWKSRFISFCMFFADMGSDRFKPMVLPILRRFIVTEWENSPSELAVLLTNLAPLDVFGAKEPKKTLLTTQLENYIQEDFKRLRREAQNVPADLGLLHLCSSEIGIFELLYSPERTQRDLLHVIAEYVHTDFLSGSEGEPFQKFAWGKCFEYLCRSHQSLDEGISAFDVSLSKSSELVGVLPYWQGIEQYLSALSQSDSHQITGLDKLIESAIRCLALPSHKLRLLGLRSLKHALKFQEAAESEILETALTIEESPFDLQSMRLISMHIRRLAASYPGVASHHWLSRAIPTYCFGLLHVHLTQIWGDLCTALKDICETRAGQDVTIQLALRWIEGSEAEWYELHDEQVDQGEDSKRGRFYTDFECSNLERVDELHVKSLEMIGTAKEQLKDRFEKEHRQIPEVTTACRGQALRVLQVMPQLAEKKSRLLVPMFLDWTQRTDNNDGDITGSGEEADTSSTTLSKQRWNRKDQKSMVSLLAAFNNPRVLYQSESVYSALLLLLSNGDSELQKPALQGLLAWKNPAIERYKEQLFNLLDDDRFREQLSVFLDVGNEDSSIQEDHREELMPVLLRLLYGRMIARGGAATKGGGLESRRKAVFSALTRFGDENLGKFLSIALGPLDDLKLISDGKVDEQELEKEPMTLRKQQGLLNMLKDMLSTLGTTFRPLVDRLIEPILFSLFSATAAMDSSEANSLARSVRQLCLQCLVAIFEKFPDLDWVVYMPAIFEKVVNPRLSNLPMETAHSISGMLKLFGAWATSPETAHLLFKYNDDVLPQIAKCLMVESAKDHVKSFVLQLVTRLTTISSDSPAIGGALERHGEGLLKAVEAVLRGHAPKDVLDLAVATVQALAPFIPRDQCMGLIEVFTFLLQQPPKRVPPKTKSEILRALTPIFASLDPHEDSSADGLEAIHLNFESIYSALGPLFAYFEDQDSRIRLSHLFELLVRSTKSLQEIATVSQGLNAFSESRLDEPDFERRQEAFETIRLNSEAWDLNQWTPIVHNLLFFIKDDEDMIRANASLCLRRFVEASAAAPQDFLSFIEATLLPAIHKGLQKSSSELVRNEYLAALAHTVKCHQELESIQDMRVLLVGDDDEASFFNNILHIQQHRRLRALRRLAKEAQTGALSSGNISRIFIPLIEHFVFDTREDGDANAHNMIKEAIETIGVLSEWLEWPQYRALIKRYSSYIESKAELEKTMMKLLGVLVDALCRAAEDRESTGNDDNNVPSKLSKTAPKAEKLSDELSQSILPQLSGYLHHKDETTVARRVPVAITIAKILRLLPEAEFSMRLSPMLTDLSNILRSRSQESRDLTRRTLADITTLIGPAYFGFVLKELRRSLQRGYQLHVLSFTVHSILVSTSSNFKLGDLDYCLNDIITIIMDDIFGVTGQEKDAEEYISKMKEVKSSKSYDSMELIAQITTIPHLIDLVRPIQMLLFEKLDERMVNKIDELLRRFRRGLVKNEAAAGRGMLVFCYEVWSEAYKSDVQPTPGADYKTKRYLSNAKVASKASSRSQTTIQTSRLVRFAIEVMRDIIPKYEELQSPANLTGFMNFIGDAIVGAQEDVKIAAMRLVASIIRVVKSFEKLDEDAMVYAREAMRVVRDAHSTHTEAAQAALRMASEILQKRQDTVIRDNDVAFLLRALKNDLEESVDRQSTAFGFVRAVINRRIVVPEVFEIADQVRAIMVRSHSRESRKLARDVYFAFFMTPDYLHTKRLFEKHIGFFVKNLSFEHAEGRQSVMETLHLLLTKSGDKTIDGVKMIDEIHDMVFLPLVMTLVNDDSEECRSFAEILIKDVFERANDVKRKGFLDMVLEWTKKDDNPTLRQTGFRCWSAYLDVQQQNAEQSPAFIKSARSLLKEATQDPNPENDELVYFALKAVASYVKLNNKAASNSAFTPDKGHLWSFIRESQFFPDIWVRLVAAKLVGLYLADFAANNAKSSSFNAVPLLGSGGLRLDKDQMFQITRANIRFIATPEPEPNEELISQAVKNLAFMGRCFAANHLTWVPGEASDPASENDEDKEDGVDSEDEMSDSEEQNQRGRKTAIRYLISRLAFVLRRAPTAPRAPALRPHLGAMQLLTSLCTNVETELLEDSLPPVLRALHNLTDPSITHLTSHDADFNSTFSALQDNARELLNKVQEKLGTEAYLAGMSKVKVAAKERREERRTKRRIEAVSMPEKVAAVKRKKREHAKEKRKERNHEMRGRRRGW